MGKVIAGNTRLPAFDRTLESGFQSPGPHEIRWDGRNDRGAIQTNGVYFIRARLGNEEKEFSIVYMR